MRFDLSDVEWALIEPLLPVDGRRRGDDRTILNGIFYILRTGAPWRDLPERYGPYTTAYNRYNRWSKRGIWGRIFEQLAAQSGESLHMIDSTVVKAHRAAAGAKGGSKIRPSASRAAVAAPKSTRWWIIGGDRSASS
jgi:transposase